jgi:DNA-directed RNA polymerase II subunit RPB1
MTFPGYLVAVNRHGINKLDTDPLSRASFEKTPEQFQSAAVFGEIDFIRSVSSRIMTGRLINLGTDFKYSFTKISTNYERFS